jgi:spoIIIJ-associated protein
VSEQPSAPANDLATSAAEEANADAQTRRALAFVRKLMAQMEMTTEVSLAPDDGEGSEGEIRLEIEGPDAGRVIGKRGAVLEAIQYLTTRVVHKPGDPRRHVQVDAEGYRARHEEQLAEMAAKLGARVAKEGKVITFDPMSARDRRVGHRALSGIEGVKTESSGEEPNRRVHIMPSAAPSTTATPAS